MSIENFLVDKRSKKVFYVPIYKLSHTWTLDVIVFGVSSEIALLVKCRNLNHVSELEKSKVKFFKFKKQAGFFDKENKEKK